MNIKDSPTASKLNINPYVRGLLPIYLSDFQKNNYEAYQKENKNTVWRDKAIIRTRLKYAIDIEMILKVRKAFYNIISMANMLGALMEKLYNMKEQMSSTRRKMETWNKNQKEILKIKKRTL